MASLKAIIKGPLTKLFFANMRRSYSQSGEDIIISDLFSRLQINKPSYLDIGANDPVALSNTYRLYTRGSHGVCVEPNPVLFKKLLRKRSKDICINTGVAFDEQKEATYYIFPEKFHGLNTFSKTDAEFWENTGTAEIGKHKIEEKITMPLISVNEIIEKYLLPHPNFITIDVEGLDLEIIKTLDFEKYKPEVFCVETLQYATNNKETKNRELINFLQGMGYFVYADTYINTIFCRKEAYKAIIP
ncbi:MAG TPA: FkbM family methyltransferase [Chitinophagaceae bacterium]|nr:FkbM family methyltransferase [Chitinophagaceae bacterium]